jgi:hypothetical protein
MSRRGLALFAITSIVFLLSLLPVKHLEASASPTHLARDFLVGAAIRFPCSRGIPTCAHKEKLGFKPFIVDSFIFNVTLSDGKFRPPFHLAQGQLRIIVYVARPPRVAWKPGPRAMMLERNAHVVRHFCSYWHDSYVTVDRVPNNGRSSIIRHFEVHSGAIPSKLKNAGLGHGHICPRLIATNFARYAVCFSSQADGAEKQSCTETGKQELRDGAVKYPFSETGGGLLGAKVLGFVVVLVSWIWGSSEAIYRIWERSADAKWERKGVMAFALAIFGFLLIPAYICGVVLFSVWWWTG